MFSRLEPILRPVIRKAEKADAKLAIRRDESKVFGRRRGGGADDEFTPVEWEDNAEVSTASLRTFLQSLLGTVPVQPVAIAPSAEGHNPTTLSSRASNAYQSMGRAVHDKNVLPEQVAVGDTEPHPETVVLGSEFSEQDLKLVRQYIDDLIDFERQGINDIVISRSLAFLPSVGQGISDIRARALAGS